MRRRAMALFDGTITSDDVVKSLISGVDVSPLPLLNATFPAGRVSVTAEQFLIRL